MAHEIVLPLLGDIMENGTIAKWLKMDGDSVDAGDLLYVVETDKISFEVQAPESGRLHRVAAEGDIVRVGGTVGWLLEQGEAVPEREAPLKPSATAQAPIASKAVAEQTAVRATPAAKHLAREHQVPLEEVRGTGPGGRIVEADVLRYLDERPAAGPSESAGPATREVIPLRGKRGLVAQRMLESLQQMAQLTITQEVEMTAVSRLRDELAQSRDGQRGVRVSYNDLIIKASAMALREHPLLNSTIRGDEIHILDQINVGVAVDAPEGLIVPVVHRVDKLSLQDIAARRSDLVERARAGRLSLDDLSHGTFTVTALGSYEVDFFTPIINPPQAAILGVGRLHKRLVLVDREVREITTLYLSLSFDHRAIDGAPAARFLRSLKGYLESPAKLMGT